ncbi:transglycosylase family protein [Streptomyces sp. NPDC048045]|uniref:transglycosylase family protein n=1 Tax=Streptomyces sp. NPDC048045 TaxID=3154710 RepID=UPI003430000B
MPRCGPGADLASRAEQITVAQAVLARQGPGAWLVMPVSASGPARRPRRARCGHTSRGRRAERAGQALRRASAYGAPVPFTRRCRPTSRYVVHRARR